MDVCCCFFVEVSSCDVIQSCDDVLFCDVISGGGVPVYVEVGSEVISIWCGDICGVACRVCGYFYIYS